MPSPFQPSEIFAIDPADAERSIGSDNIKRFLDVYRWVYKRQATWSALEMRIAPSIIARSESELFGTSSPRFALRVYLDQKRRSFVNIRRLAELSDQLATAKWNALQKQPTRVGGKEFFEVHSTSSLAKFVKTNNCIGDSLLEVPARIKNAYFVLDAELGLAYGEGEAIRGTPYVQAMSYFGGACAQACCFMAQALLHEYPLAVRDHGLNAVPKFIGIHGVAEITAIIADPVDEYLEITGLDLRDVTRYLEEMGRSALAQRSGELTPSEVRWTNFRRALRAYAISGVPTILSVNCSAFEQAVYERQKPQVRQSSPSWRSQSSPPDHAIVLVGCGRLDEDKFLVNDPKRFPFVEASFEELRSCCQKNSNPLTFVAVQPAEVKLPLETQIRDAYAWPGLFDISRLLQCEHPNWRHKSYPQVVVEDLSSFDPGAFQLLKISQVVGRLDCDGVLSDAQIIPEVDQNELSEVWKELSPLEGTWCWIQWMPATRSIWVWNAEKTADPCWLPPDQTHPQGGHFRFAESALWAVIVKDKEGRWRTEFINNKLKKSKPRVASTIGAKNEKVKLPASVSIISSFAANGISQASQNWPSSAEKLACEYYVYMHRDPVMLNLRSKMEGVPISALSRSSALRTMAQVMSSGADNTDRLIEMAAQSLREARDAENRAMDVVALASYLPEISAEQSEDAIAAVKFLLRLGGTMRTFAEAHGGPGKVRVIELVAGSRITGVGRVRARDEGSSEHSVEGYLAHRSTAEAAIVRLIKNLKRAIQDGGLNDNFEISIALELEPGPLYVLNNLENMHKIAQVIDDAGLTNRVGFNLDIAHFALAGIAPKQLLQKEHRDVLTRICHVHLSDHGQGHFGDVPAGQAGLGRGGNLKTRLESFRPWLELIVKRYEFKNEQHPKMSGYVSVELEAAKGGDVVRNSVVNLRSIAEFL